MSAATTAKPGLEALRQSWLDPCDSTSRFRNLEPIRATFRNACFLIALTNRVDLPYLTRGT